MKNHILTKPVPTTWMKPLTSWETKLRAGGASENTINTRVRHVRQLARGLDNTPPAAVTSEMLLDWCGHQNWMPETRHAYYASFRSFFKHISANLNKNPADSLPTVRRIPGLPRPTPEDCLRKAVNESSDRTRLIITLAAQIGLRAHEIAQVHQNDISHDILGLSLTVKGKGGRERLIPLPHNLGNELLATTSANGGWAFPGQIDGHLSPRWISKLASKVLPTPWTLHTVRHRFATRAYSAERDLLAVQRLLGHSSVATTQRYAAPPEDALRHAVAAAKLT